MKMKRLLAFLMSGLVMLSCTACSEDDNTKKDSTPDTTISETDTSDKQDSDINNSTEDDNSTNNGSTADSDVTVPDAVITPFRYTDSNCKSIYICIDNLAQKCQTAGKRLSITDDDCTGVLVINSATGESVKILNVEGASSANPTLSESAIKAISKAVDNYLPKNSEKNLVGSVYCVYFNSSGFPSEVFWAEDETSEIVGKYPSEDTYAYTEGGIKSIIENGPEAFGNKPLV